MHSNQKGEFQCFLKFPALATPNKVDRVMKDWWRMTSLQEHIKVYLLDDRIASPTKFVCFLSRKTPPLIKQQLPELEGFRDSWNDVTAHSKTQTPFCTDTRSSSLGVAEAGTLKLHDRGLKCQNPNFFFLEYLFTHYRATITIKTLLVV